LWCDCRLRLKAEVIPEEVTGGAQPKGVGHRQSLASGFKPGTTEGRARKLKMRGKHSENSRKFDRYPTGEEKVMVEKKYNESI